MHRPMVLSECPDGANTCEEPVKLTNGEELDVVFQPEFGQEAHIVEDVQEARTRDHLIIQRHGRMTVNLLDIKSRPHASTEIEWKMAMGIRKHQHSEQIDFASITFFQTVGRIFSS